ncbi:hypothetical protein BayCH28_06265 [Mycolicibacterium sp. CH28]|uniref:hypothetical protein n=1 Tax=Mycolicibacterium sp. CH28 TaxID=2512237 RepID=UPI001080B721|nr:hypothetical protein [Mycolicibacterium sp. CH28]TGD88983.1 hypothetical protein BayCH28_06265 [Mycolicibacterium sp. CH28]
MPELTRAARTNDSGGSAMGALAITFDDGAALNSPAVAAPIMPDPMTQGDTVTTTIPPTVLATENGCARGQGQALRPRLTTFRP